jgi:hypothetical protein
MSRKLRKLAVAVSTGRVTAVFLECDTVVATKISRCAALSKRNAARIVQAWISGFKPHYLIAEHYATALRKGQNTRAILKTINALFEETDGLDIRLRRTQSYPNKYVEAKALVEKYPEIAHLYVQQPPIWMPEPRNMGYFEALSLVQQVTPPPP